MTPPSEAKPFRGGGINLDLNTIGQVRLRRVFGVRANIIADQFGGTQGPVTVTTLSVLMSANRFNEFFTEFLDNVVYMGDGSITSNTPWKIVSNNPLGWRGDMEWETGLLSFRAADNAPMVLPMAPNPERPGDFRCVFSFVFYLMAKDLAQHTHYAVPHFPYQRLWPPTTINQTTVSRAALANGYELAGMHGTQTFITV